VSDEAPAPEYEGDPRHPDHGKFLAELGAAVYAAAGVAGIAVDILRTHFGEDFFDLVDDPLGGLISRLDAHDKGGSAIPGLGSFVRELRLVRDVRNDLIHALVVLHGLHRRTRRDRARVVNFFTTAELDAARLEFERVRRQGSELLYFDDGKAVRALYERP
jgi:hypothetical protein